ncbi:hypothetical protein GOP47_0025371 [Adiantum capillus-veneris]|uniref:Uncharacterized protein n=1 Tax=Adiantum capillus-veneris TaxID=13818 RepID=A0A9D4U0V7_ADICA|nr:hypothetical protein GOP47_0025371 [Adiantum capillus-veneris]
MTAPKSICKPPSSVHRLMSKRPGMRSRKLFPTLIPLAELIESNFFFLLLICQPWRRSTVTIVDVGMVCFVCLLLVGSFNLGDFVDLQALITEAPRWLPSTA